jgi:hypothetical protein
MLSHFYHEFSLLSLISTPFFIKFTMTYHMFICFSRFIIFNNTIISQLTVFLDTRNDNTIEYLRTQHFAFCYA